MSVNSRTLMLVVALALVSTVVPVGDLSPTGTAEAMCYWDGTVEGSVDAAQCAVDPTVRCVKALIKKDSCPA